MTHAHQIASLWGAAPDTVVHVSDGINTIFRFTRSTGVAYLRLSNPTIIDEPAVQRTVHFLQHLAAAGAPVCHPLPSLRGHLIEDATYAGNSVIATAVTAVPGASLDNRTADLEALRAWGGALAEVHVAGANYRPGSHQFLTWDKSWADVPGRLPAADAALLSAYRAVNAWLDTLPRDADCFGMTHGDCRAANVIYDGQQARMIDFDAPEMSWYAADVARALVDFVDAPSAVDAFIRGYRTVRPIEDVWVKQLGSFMAMKALEMFSWTHACWHNPVAPGGGDTQQWLAVLRSLALTFAAR